MAMLAQHPVSMFQSTLPARAATVASPHAFSAGCIVFQSTLPARGATARRDRRTIGHVDVSIHAARAGSDDRQSTLNAR